FPVIASAVAATGSVTGSLNSTPNTAFTIQVFSNAACDPSGNGEGQTLLGSVAALTGATGNPPFAFSTSLTAGQFVTAKATDPNGNTSEFSQCVTVVNSFVGGSALTFDGINDFVTIPDAPSLDLLNQFTIEAWTKIDGPGFFRMPLVSKGLNFGNYTLAVL